jgi:hypothetical protein
VALARALATEPDVLLLDEPLSNLDAKLRQELRLELKALLRSVGTTTIVVIHDQEEAITLSEHVIIVNRGRIEQQGPPDEVYGRPRNRFVAEFIGRTTGTGRLTQTAGPGLWCFESEGRRSSPSLTTGDGRAWPSTWRSGRATRPAATTGWRARSASSSTWAPTSTTGCAFHRASGFERGGRIVLPASTGHREGQP